ncbi:MAG TPA: hypothetical protein DDY88_06915 [Actinobacteria bacterium]|nr:hypothetical protein [Actinomycetota bacterium]
MALGAFTSIVAVVVALFTQGALNAYWNQAILWPVRWGGGDATTPSAYLDLMKLLLPQLLPVVLTLVIAWLWYLQHRAGQSGRTRPRWLVVLSTAAGILIIAIEGRNLVLNAPGGDIASQLLSPNFVYLNFTNPNYDYLYLFLALAFTCSLLSAAISFILRVKGRIPTQVFGYWLLLAAMTLAGALTVIPRWDPRHVWWGIPIGLILIAACINLAGTLWQVLKNPLLIVLLAVAVMVGVSSVQTLGRPRVESPADWITRGMYLPKDISDAIERDFSFLSRYVLSDTRVVYLVPDGDLSILLGHFQSADPYFVSWGIPSTQAGRLNDADVVIVYGLTNEGLSTELINDLKDFRVAETQGPYRIFIPNKGA